MFRKNNLNSIVDKINNRLTTGEHLGIEVHQHYGFRVELKWFGESREHSIYIKRHFKQYEVMGICDRTMEEGGVERTM